MNEKDLKVMPSEECAKELLKLGVDGDFIFSQKIIEDNPNCYFSECDFMHVRDVLILLNGGRKLK